MVGRRLAILMVGVIWPLFAGAASSPLAGELSELLSRWDGDPHPDLRAVIVLRHGRVIGERYYNGETPTGLHDVRSAGKSLTALLVGAALDRGKIASVDTPVDQYWMEARGSAVGNVLLKDILTMRSGLAALDSEPDSPGNENKLDQSPDPRGFILAVPRADSPGTVYRYNSVTAHVAGLVVQEATGENLQTFAERALFDPLGIKDWSWQTDAAGDFKGQGNLSLTARDFAKFGQLVLDKGLFKGRRVIGADWIEAALAPKVGISAVDPYADSYGYFWYFKTQRIDGTEIPVSFASGNGGNKIYVVPSLDLVVAITSSAYGQGYGQRRSEDILKAILAKELSAAGEAHLTTEVYAADEAAYGVTSTLIYGPTEAVLVDAQFRNSDAERLADLIRARGRRLAAVFITHPDLDHYLGLAVLHRRFPKAAIYMTPQALAEFKRSWADSLASRRRAAPAETPETLPIPQALPKPMLSVDGRRIEILRNLQGDYASAPLNSPVWIPSDQVLIADDLAFNGIHAWLEDSSEAGRAEWRNAIAQLEALRPRIVIAGHKRSANLPDTPAVLAFTSAYLADFDALRRDCPDVQAFITAMTNKYPELGLPKFLAWAAASAYRK